MKKRALIIGNGDYEHVDKLKNPTNDAEDMRDALSNIGFEVEYTSNTSLKKFNKQVKTFSDKALNSDILFFYYAGHGLQYNGENFLVPVDANIEESKDISVESINLVTIEERFADTNSKANIFILDSCRDNPFEINIKRYAQSRNIAPRIDRGLANTSISISESLIAFATSPNEVALDNPEGRNGLFTKSLLNHIKKENLTIQEILDLTGKDIVEESKEKQRPWIHNSIFKTKAILNFNEKTLVSNNDKTHLDKIAKLEEALSEKNKNIESLELEVKETLNTMETTTDDEVLEREKAKLKALNRELESVQTTEGDSKEHSKDDVLIYKGVIENSFSLDKKDNLQNTMKLYVESNIQNKIDDYKPFEEVFKKQSEFEPDIAYKIREIEFEQKNIRYETEKKSYIDTLKVNLLSKESKEKILDFFLGKQNISMQYNANIQTFTIRVNDFNFEMTIPLDVAPEFKETINSFNIYFDFQKSAIVEINAEFKNQTYRAKNLPKISDNIFKTIFTQEYLKEKEQVKLKELHSESTEKKKFFSFASKNRLLNKIKSLGSNRYQLINEGLLVKDTITQLQWMRCSLGQIWDGKTCVGEATSHLWQDALDKAESYQYAGFSDWRVPTLEELFSLEHSLTDKPKQYRQLFPNPAYGRYWSYSLYADDSSNTLSFNFVRLVRGGK